MVLFNKEKCIGCGACINDCFQDAIEIIEGKAAYIAESCMECGHCMAICPTGAVSIEGLDMGEVLECSKLNSAVDPEVYMNMLRSRRSIRHFTDRPVSIEDINTIIEAGRFSPTGGNRQTVSYYVFRDRIHEFRQMILEELNSMGYDARNAHDTSSWYPEKWISMYDKFISTGRDELFFDSSTVIVVASDNPQSAGIASGHMEAMVYSLGLGMLYSGFTARAVTHSERIRKYLGLKDKYQVYTVFVLGYPDIKYIRTVPRKKADVIWI